jgi:hypothetical protein
MKAKKVFDAVSRRRRMNVYAAFVERGIQLLVSRGMLGAITSRTGFFLSSFQRWREDIILDIAPPLVFADLGLACSTGRWWKLLRTRWRRERDECGVHRRAEL